MKALAPALASLASVAAAAEQTAFGIASDPAKVKRTIVPGRYESGMKGAITVK